VGKYGEKMGGEFVIARGRGGSFKKGSSQNEKGQGTHCGLRGLLIPYWDVEI